MSSVICPIFKKGDPTKVSYYRGISLLDTAYKVLSIAILRRIEVLAIDIVGKYQCGFSRGRSISDHIFTIRQTMEKYYEYDKDLHMIFIDFRQAYDSIDREQLWTVLQHFGLPKKLVNFVKNCNSNTTCKVRFEGLESGNFEVKSGLRQGDALSPIFFNMVLEKVVRDIHETRKIGLTGNGTLYAYAENIVILGDSQTEVEESTKKLIKSSKIMGLNINEDKTKYMVMSRRPRILQNISVDGYIFEQVEDFKYLGDNLNNRNDMHDKIKLRLNTVNRGYFAMIKLFTSKLLFRETKKKLYISYLWRIVVHGGRNVVHY